MKKFVISLILSFVLFFSFSFSSYAAEFTATVDGVKTGNLVTNTSYSSKTNIKANSTVEVTSETNISSFYVVWYKVPGPWKVNDTLTIDSGFLREFVELDTPATSFKFTPQEDCAICYIKVFAEGETIPDDIQRWEKPLDQADVMAFSPHADDESLFLGGAVVDILANHPDAKVQLVYMTNHIKSECFRENERLDALWTLGLRNYPIIGEFPDAYAMDSLEAGLHVCDYDGILAWFIELINEKKPQVIITVDFNGEYGHAQHMVQTKAVCEAVEKCAADGTHDVKKLYVHLYKDSGAMRLDLRQPLDAYGGMTALDVQKEAYKKHLSQQWCWFYVDDEYKYSCAEFGLYRTTVPADTGNDMMENITTYQAIKEEEERIAAEKAAQEAANKPQKNENDKKENKSSNIFKKILFAILGIILALIVATVLLRLYNKSRKSKRYQPKHGSK